MLMFGLILSGKQFKIFYQAYIQDKNTLYVTFKIFNGRIIEIIKDPLIQTIQTISPIKLILKMPLKSHCSRECVGTKQH